MSSEFAPETLNDLTDYYLILDLKPDASPSDIREAYLRAKATFQKDNVALYTLIDGSEREDMLRRVEEAYQVLSNPERRREYDRFYGQISSNSLPASQQNAPAPAPETAKIISIDRTAPMDTFGAHENPLEPPRTDIRPPIASPPGMPPQSPSAFQLNESAPAHPASNLSAAHTQKSAMVSKALADLEKEIAEQTEWSGAFIRHVREARGVSIEEVTQATKITKAYILAIEEENYGKLPAAVFIRGFVSQLARLLKLPAQNVSVSYMARLQRSNPEKFR
ncbi:MAG: helix-turn-helix domain-containing protein [Bdellovibrionia bacterium]